MKSLCKKNGGGLRIILLLTVVILFEIVQTKIVHYSSLAYFPLTYLSALAILQDNRRKKPFHQDFSNRA